MPGAHHEMAPTAAQVMNALLAEEVLDEKVAKTVPHASIGSAQKKSSNNPNNQKALIIQAN